MNNPLEKAIKELRAKKQILEFNIPSNITGTTEDSRFEVVLLEDAEEIIQKLEIDITNEFHNTKVEERKGWKQSSNQSDLPNQKL